MCLYRNGYGVTVMLIMLDNNGFDFRVTVMVLEQSNSYGARVKVAAVLPLSPYVSDVKEGNGDGVGE
jgi:hypothetical protein